MIAISSVSANDLEANDEIAINEDISDDITVSDDGLISKDSSNFLSVSDDEWDIKDSSDVLSVSDEGDDNPLYDDNLKIKEESNLSDSISVSGNTFVDIQNAIDSAKEGDTIKLSGTYTGDGNQISIDKPLTILGTGETILDAQGLSRIFYSESDNLVLKNLKLINGNFSSRDSHSFGGTVYFSGGNCSIIDCIFMNSLVNITSTAYNIKSHGGAIYISGGDCSLLNCSFVNCSGDSNNSGGGSSGSAVYCDGVNASIVDCSFENCSCFSYTTDYSGTVCIAARDCSLLNCTFENCAADSGGAVSNRYAVNGSVVGCSFVNCSASDYWAYGGAVYWNGANSSLSDCSFVNCSASGHGSYGGAVYWNGANSSLSDCSFVNCSVSDSGNFESYGGAVYWAGAYGSVFNCSFVNCSSVEGGGAVRFTTSSNYSSIENCSFVNCTVSSNHTAFPGSGGGLSVGSNHAVFNCSFVNCSAFRGGAVYCYGANLSWSGCSFLDCSAGDFGGAAIYWNTSKNDVPLQIEDCIFLNNVGSDNVILIVGNSSIINCNFLNNTVTGDSVIHVLEGKANISSCIFDNNNNLLASFSHIFVPNLDNNFYGFNIDSSYEFDDICFFNYSNEDISQNITPNYWFTLNFINSAYPNQFALKFISNDYSFNSTPKNYPVRIEKVTKDGEVLYNQEEIVENGLLSVSYSSELSEGKMNVYSIYSGKLITSVDVPSFSLTALKQLINQSGNTITLYHDYAYAPGDDVGGILIDKNLTIHGNGQSINGKSVASIFNVTKGNTLIIDNLEFKNSSKGVIYNYGTLNISNSKFVNNSKTVGNKNGSAIYSNGSLFIKDSSFINCSASYGGAIYSLAKSTIINSSFKNNSATCGDDIYNGGNLSLSGNHLSNDHATIYNDYSNRKALIISPVRLVILDNSTKVLRYNEPHIAYAKLLDDNNNLIEDGKINLTIDSVTKTALFNGVDQFEYKIVDIKESTFVSGNYAGASNLRIETGHIYTLSIPATADAMIGLANNGDYVTISLKTLGGNAIPNGILNVSLNGKESTLRTNSKGEARVNISGNATIRASYTDSNGASVSSSIVVERMDHEVEKVVYVNNTVEVEKIVYVNQTVEVPVEKIVYVNQTVEKIVYVNKTVEVPVEVEKIVYVNSTTGVPIVSEKIVYLNQTVEVPVEKIVYVNQTVEVPVEKIVYVNNTIGVAPNRTATKIVYSDMITTAVAKVDGRVGEYFYVTLKDAKGKALANKFVQIGFNGAVYNRTTNKTGGVRLQINLGYAGKYTFAIAFLGDDNYTGSFEVALITVNAQKPKLTTAKKTYKASAKTKALTATLKSVNGNPVSGKTLTFTVNGKSYTGKTNSKGVATVNISLNKKGTYSFTVKYDTDGMYATTSAKSSVKIA